MPVNTVEVPSVSENINSPRKSESGKERRYLKSRKKEIFQTDEKKNPNPNVVTTTTERDETHGSGLAYSLAG